jgi:cytochrome c oxidase assembly protein subunit 15
MGVEDFKKIFFWEWMHRLWGRLIGLTFAIPLLVFWIRHRIPQDIKPNLIILLLLGAAQGYMGWYMVKSGLVDQPSVSHYRLAAHLSLALIVYAYMLWTGLRLWTIKPPFAANTQNGPPSFLLWRGIAALACVAITIVWGAFVAGLHAGLIYNTFPLMGNGLIPPEMWAQNPLWLNLFENHASVQFTHRWLGVITGLVTLFYAWTGIKLTARPVFTALAVWVFVQIGLGLTTLLSQVWIPVAVFHQLGAVILLSLVIAGLQVAIPARSRLSA